MKTNQTLRKTNQGSMKKKNNKRIVQTNQTLENSNRGSLETNQQTAQPLKHSRIPISDLRKSINDS